MNHVHEKAAAGMTALAAVSNAGGLADLALLIQALAAFVMAMAAFRRRKD